MVTMTMDEARHWMGMPVPECKCTRCAEVIRERQEQTKAALLAIQRLKDAGIKFDQEYVQKEAERLGVPFLRKP